MVEWLEKLTKEIGVSEFFLAGHSQGCLIALEYVFKYSAKVKKLIFIAGSYEIPVNQSLIDLALKGDIRSFKFNDEMGVW